MAVAKALGARRVIAVDINQERLDFAKSYAATDIYLPVRLLSSLLSFSASPADSFLFFQTEVINLRYHGPSLPDLWISVADN